MTKNDNNKNTHTSYTQSISLCLCLGVKGFPVFKCTMLISQFIRESSITAKRNVMLTVCHGRTTAAGLLFWYYTYINLHFFSSFENVTFLSRIIFATGFLQVRQTRHTHEESIWDSCASIVNAWFHSMQVLFSVSAIFRLSFLAIITATKVEPFAIKLFILVMQLNHSVCVCVADTSANKIKQTHCGVSLVEVPWRIFFRSKYAFSTHFHHINLTKGSCSFWRFFFPA